MRAGASRSSYAGSMFSPRSKGPHIRHGMINARAETLTTEPAYRNDRPEMLDPFGL